MLQLFGSAVFYFNDCDFSSLTGVYWLTVAFIFPAATCLPFGLQQTVKNRITIITTVAKKRETYG